MELPGQPIDILERQLAKFDSEVGNALVQVAKDKSLNDSGALLVLLNLISALATRNPQMREKMEGFHTRIHELVADLVSSDKGIFESTMRRAKAAGDIKPETEVSFEQMRDFIKRDGYYLEFPPGFHIATEFSTQDTVLQTLVKRQWALFRAAPGCDFITSDHPVGLWPRRPMRAPLGYGMKNTTVIFPINTSLLMIGNFEDGPIGVHDIPREHVATLNLMIATRANRLVLAKSDRFETLDEEGQIHIGPEFILQTRARSPEGRGEHG